MSRHERAFATSGWFLEAWIQEFRHSLRGLFRSPAFTVSTVTVLALGIGANAALFTVLYGVLLRPLPYRDADRLVVIDCERSYAEARLPVPAYFRLQDGGGWRETSRAFDEIALFVSDSYVLTGASGSQVVTTAVVSNTFFSTFTGTLAAGRALDRSDDAAPSVVMSERLARQLFNTPRQALGAQLPLNARAFTVVGVVDRSYALPSPAVDLWVPAEYEQTVRPRGGAFRVGAHQKPGVTIEQTRADVNAAIATLARTNPAMFGNGLRATIIPLREQIVGNVRSALIVLWVAAGLILIVSCANVANLLLVRNAVFSRDRSIRAALGASTSRLMLRGVADGVLLTAAGTAAGIVLAAVVVWGLVQLEPASVPLLRRVQLNGPGLLFTIGLSAITALAIGVLPAVQWIRQPAPTLTISAHGAGHGTARAGGRIGRTLCIVQLAVAMVLLVGAALLNRSLMELLRTDIGVTTEHVTAVSLRPALQQPRRDADTVSLTNRIVTQVRALPGVRAAGVGSSLPPTSSGIILTLKRHGDSVDYAATGVTVTPGYFESLSVRLLKGRLFTDADDDAHPQVIILSDATARRFLGDEDPIGRTVSLPTVRNGTNGSADMTVVGVISAVKYAGLTAEADEQVYRPFAQQPWRSVFLVARTDADAAGFPATLRRLIAATDPSLAVVSIKTLDTIVAEETATPRFRSMLLGGMAVLAVVLAAVGLYGIVAYSVSQRTSEIAVRLALGADRRTVTGMVLKDGLVLGLSGTALGLLGGYIASRWLQAVVYGISVTDPASFLLSAVLLLITALMASYVPAARAARIEPSVALRIE